jgi:hypothetical protein
MNALLNWQGSYRRRLLLAPNIYRENGRQSNAILPATDPLIIWKSKRKYLVIKVVRREPKRGKRAGFKTVLIDLTMFLAVLKC